MKKNLLLITAAIVVLLAGCTPRVLTPEQNAEGVVRRTFGSMPGNVVFAQIPAEDSLDVYLLEVKDGCLKVSGSTPVAMCRGFYDYIESNGYGMATWSGNRLALPDSLPDMAAKKVVSPFRDHLYYNVCTYGYTTPFWGWEQWQKEIDWMALHGIDMPLAPIGGESVFRRVWLSMGLSRDQIGEYFTGPAHFPWMRMGNMSKLDGNESEKWFKAQIKLEHKILGRMRGLGMKPLCQGFAGFVPEAMKEVYPNVDITETHWAGFRNYMLSPKDSLFAEIEKRYITEWEKEFGKCKYYLIDSFNEMDIPFGDKGTPERSALLAEYGKVIWSSLSAADSDAVWVMQGWMFGYQRDIWDPGSVRDLLSEVPDDKMMIIDLAVDFNQYVWRSSKNWDRLDGFYGKKWIYSTVPNFGGRSALTGALDFYANAHLNALKSPNRGNLTGYGTSPEGVEQNEPVYELIAAAGWSSSEIDVREFLHEYSVARYGACPPQIDSFWNNMLRSVYGTCTNNARFKWQLRPYEQFSPTMDDNADYYRGIEYFLSAADSLSGSQLYRTDAALYGAMYLAAKADEALSAVNWAYVSGDTTDVEKYRNATLGMLTGADRLLESHPVLRMARWLDFAQAAGRTEAERHKFVTEARRIVTIWGPPVNDYSARIWSGLIRDYYIPRIRQYFECKAAGTGMDWAPFDSAYVFSNGISPVSPYSDPIAAADSLVAKYGVFGESDIAAPANAVAFWSPYEFDRDKMDLSFSIPAESLVSMKGFRLTYIHGSVPVKLTRVRVSASGYTLSDVKNLDVTLQPAGSTVSSSASSATVPLQRNETIAFLYANSLKNGRWDNSAAKEESLPRLVSVHVTLQGAAGCDSYGAITTY
ncbi:MAG: alpha-N-acetylglucosaminidase [Bacteroidales bacterium]|jgi:alpha-N-acetylglucosaminidase|nr:alpha-N-acetylglucosaminidase [Bacteroidales bacterium]MCI2121561.1 alpha-N-acetylglucosaminidase [Bacteroidales bacterium]MCI2145074.1 alpha-N-acetylglucosaminidase [Bacteroidales bacterium]